MNVKFFHDSVDLLPIIELSFNKEVNKDIIIENIEIKVDMYVRDKDYKLELLTTDDEKFVNII